MGNLASIAEMFRTNPSMRQMLIETAAKHDPALGQRLSQNPTLLDSLLRSASVQAGLYLHTWMLSPEERGAVQRVSATLLFFSH